MAAVAGPTEARGMLATLRSHASAVCAGAMALVLLHLLDIAAFDRRPGTSVHENLFLLAVPLTLGVATALLLPRLRPGVQAWLAFVAGSLAVVEGGLHVSHVRRPGAGVGGPDVTAFAAGLGGIALLVTALALAVRPKRQRSRSRRWLARAGAAVGVGATAFLVVMPVGGAIYLTDKPSVHVASSRLRIPHEDVWLRTSDGLRLAAWYVPSRNGASVVLVHGAGGDRAGGIESRAVMLARHGYGVLTYDARGSGDSDGNPENLGWTWHRDVEAAVRFLQHRPDIHGGRIGALGLSTGAEAVLDTAARGPSIRAVVAEGAQMRTVTDSARVPGLGRAYFVAYGAIMYTAADALSHAPEPPPLRTQVERIAPRPVLLISSGTSFERDLDRVYARAGGRTTSLWELPDAPHTGGLAAHPRAYERRVVGFFDRALVGG